MSSWTEVIDGKVYRLVTNAKERDKITFVEAARLVNLKHWRIDKAYDYAGNLISGQFGFYVEDEFYNAQAKELELWGKADIMIRMELCQVLEERGYKMGLTDVYLGMDIPAKREKI